MKKIAILLLISMFFLTGCAMIQDMLQPKDTLTADGVIRIIQNEYAHTRIEQIPEVDTVLIGDKDFNWIIEFHDFGEVISLRASANSNFNAIVQDIEFIRANRSTTRSSSGANWERFTATKDGHYFVVMRIDNTLVYVETTTGYRNEVQELLQLIGYW
jgi:hypothetical protein